MKWFDYAAPETIGQAGDLLLRNPGARALAGGTDLLVQMRAGRLAPPLVVDMKLIPELNEMTDHPQNGLTLGAAVPCYRINRDAAVSARYPGLAEVAALIGGVQIQGRASIGGNLCNSAPSADAIPLLIAMRARCRIAGPSGEREMAVEDFCTGPGRNVLDAGELLVSLRIPAPEPHSGACYLRFIPRNEMDIAVAGAGVALSLEDGRIRSARVALSSVAPIPLYVAEAGAALAGRAPDAASFRIAGEIARDAARPIADMRGGIEHRRQLCAVLTARAFDIAASRARENGNHA